MLNVHLIAGARPNFMKVGPLYHAMSRTDWVRPILVHTGQHYDRGMSDVFLADIGLPTPHYCLEVGSNTHAKTTAAVMVAYEKICDEASPDLVVVAGDVDSTVAAALCAKKKGLSVAHLEAGLRSFDRTMPEEINRIVTDAIADLLWTPSEDADQNLAHEGVDAKRIVRVGNIMIDTYEMLAPKILMSSATKELGLEKGGYGVVTLHRPINVDNHQTLEALLLELLVLSKDLPLVFPVHPRTRGRMTSIGGGLKAPSGSLKLIDPLGYIDFMNVVSNAALVITDSGGIQEETTYLGIPCLTVRDTTERPITVTHGTNRLIRRQEIVVSARDVLKMGRTTRPIIPLWDGRTSERILASVMKWKSA